MPTRPAGIRCGLATRFSPNRGSTRWVPSFFQVGVGGDPDRNRLLNRTRQHGKVAEVPKLSIVIDVLAGRGEAQYLDRFLHAAHPAGGLDPEMGELLLEV